jgi:hypothetical protein
VYSNKSLPAINNSLGNFKHNNNLTKNKKVMFYTQRVAAAAAVANYKKVIFNNDKIEEN